MPVPPDARQADTATQQCLLLAQSGHPDALNQCPLLGVKRVRRRKLSTKLNQRIGELGRLADAGIEKEDVLSIGVD
jgi:hypothetical protein